MQITVLVDLSFPSHLPIYIKEHIVFILFILTKEACYCHKNEFEVENWKYIQSYFSFKNLNKNNVCYVCKQANKCKPVVFWLLTEATNQNVVVVGVVWKWLYWTVQRLATGSGLPWAWYFLVWQSTPQNDSRRNHLDTHYSRSA